MTQHSPIGGAESVRYARTTDGAPIAVLTSGVGRPVVWMPSLFWITMQMLEPVREATRAADASRTLGAHHRLIRYDARGTGLSGGAPTDLTVEIQVQDLQAAIESVTDGAVTLVAPGHCGPAAIAYAAEHPERVEALILWSAYSDGARWATGARSKLLRQLLDQDGQVFANTLSLQLIGWDEPDAAAVLARLIAENSSSADVASWGGRQLDLMSQVDVSDRLSELVMPTLVIGRLEHFVPAGAAAELARIIPGGWLTVLRATALSPLIGDSEEAHRAIEQLLSELPRQPRSPR